MTKCKYCDNNAEWFNPFTNSYMCDEHAKMKLVQYKEEKTIDGIDEIETFKDLFLKHIEYDTPEEERKDFGLNTRLHKVVHFD